MIKMDPKVQRITVFANKLRVEEIRVKKIAVIDGVDTRAERDLTKAIVDAYKDPTVNKVVLMRTYIPEEQAN